MVFTKTQQLIASGVSVVVIFLIGFLIGHFYNRNVRSTNINLVKILKESDPKFLDILKREIKADNLRNYLK